MNIWIFNHYAIKPSTSGGTRHYDMAKELVSNGHNVAIFASSFNHFSREETIDYDANVNYIQEIVDGINFVWIRTPQYKNIIKRIQNIISYTIKSFFKAMKMIRSEKPDVIIGSSVHPLAALVGYLISKRTGSLYYFEERDLWPQTFVDFGKMSKRNPLVIILYKLELFFYNKADRIIILFDKAQEYVNSKGISNEKIIYLPNGVNLKSYSEILNTSHKVDEVFSDLEDKCVCVYLGSHGIANDLEPLIDLFKEIEQDCEELHLLLIGEGPEKNRLQHIVKDYNLSNISFKSSVPKSIVPSVLKRADLSIISIKDSPLYKWGFSMNKIYDYMASGLPIIMLANPLVVSDLSKVRGIHASLDRPYLRKVMQEYARNSELIESDGNVLKKHVIQYSWETLALRLENYMKEDLKNVRIN